MISIIKFFIPLYILAIVGCTPFQQKPLPKIQSAEYTQVIIQREASFNAVLAPMVFGENGADYIEITNGKAAKIYLKSGATSLFVRSTQGDKPFFVNTRLIPGKDKCFKAFANPKNYIKSLFFSLGYYFGNTFKLEEINCPSESFIKTIPSYNAVEISN